MWSTGLLSRMKTTFYVCDYETLSLHQKPLDYTCYMTKTVSHINYSSTKTGQEGGREERRTELNEDWLLGEAHKALRFF